MKKIFNVEGMSCNHCKIAVEKALKVFDGITEVEVNLSEKIVTVTFDSNQVGLDQIITVIEEQGYNVLK